MDEWTEWRGGKCPAKDVRVEVRTRNGKKYRGRVERFDWRHYGDACQDGDSDIIAYRVTSPVHPDTGA